MTQKVMTIEPVAFSSPTFQTTIVGYGRYGNNYIGPKYAKSGYSWEVVAIVDPIINPFTFKQSVLGKHKPQTYLFKSFNEWHNIYFKSLDEKQKARQVIEIALKPELVYEQLMLYVQAGVKHFILPKPVVTNQKELMKITAILQKHKVKAAVASQWYYSDIPKFIKREIQRMIERPKSKNAVLPVDKNTQNNLFNIYFIEVKFSKENGRAYATKPPLLELPHALQLLNSIGLIDFHKHLPEVSGTDTVVNVIYRPENITQGIHIQASIDLAPHPLVKSRFPLWDIQERCLKIYLQKNSVEPNLKADFWIKFDRSGEVAVRPGELVILDNDEYGNQQKLTLNFVDDQLLHMNIKIYEAFQKGFIEFQNNNHILSLDRYGSIGQQIMLIQQMWELVKDNDRIVDHKVASLS